MADPNMANTATTEPEKPEPTTKPVTAPTSLYFRTFKDFEHFPENPITEEFERLAALRQWKKGNPTWMKQWTKFVNLEYTRLIGKRDLVTLADWQLLCGQLGLEGPFPSIKRCKKVCLCWVELVGLDVGFGKGWAGARSWM